MENIFDRIHKEIQRVKEANEKRYQEWRKRRADIIISDAEIADAFLNKRGRKQQNLKGVFHNA